MGLRLTADPRLFDLIPAKNARSSIYEEALPSPPYPIASSFAWYDPLYAGGFYGWAP